MILILALLLACDVPVSVGSTEYQSSHWVPLETPPGANAGLTCYVWTSQASTLSLDSAYGGPLCFMPDSKENNE